MPLGLQSGVWAKHVFDGLEVFLGLAAGDEKPNEFVLFAKLQPLHPH